MIYALVKRRRFQGGQIARLNLCTQFIEQVCVEAAKKALANNELELANMVDKMRGVRYVSTLVIEQLDPFLRTFFNVNAPLDLKKALTMMKQRKNRILRNCIK